MTELNWGMVQKSYRTRRAYATVSPSGNSIVGSLISGEKDPTDLRGKPAPTGGISGGLGSNDQDCASSNLLGFLWEPLCVAGKSTTKFVGEAGKWLPLIAIGGIGIVVIILVLKRRG